MQKESACTIKVVSLCIHSVIPNSSKHTLIGKAISKPLFKSLTDLSKREGRFLHSEYPTNRL